MGEAEQPVVVGVVGFKPLRERFQQHGHTEERPGNLDQRQPFSVVTSDGRYAGTPLETRSTR